MARLFGTDGVRGVAGSELTIELATQLGQAGAYVLTKEQEHQATIMVGCDTRISGGMLASALMAGICSVGANVIFVGVMPTPAIAYLTRKHKVDAGVVISASHNPMEFNGIKFFNGEGYKLSDELEDEIEALIRNQMKDVELPVGAGVGKIDYRFDLRDEYVEFMEECVPVDLSEMKIVVDCAEGASHYTSVKALTDLGAQLVAIHTEPDGTNINANCGSTHMDELKARVVAEKANVGIAFDGENVWVCNSSKNAIERISYDFIQLMASQNSGEVVDATEVVDIYKVSNVPSCITYYGNRLWIATHTKFINSKMKAYFYDKKSDSLKTLSTYKIPAKVQGIAFDEDGAVYLSTSYGRRSSSYIRKYFSVIQMASHTIQLRQLHV